MAQSREIGKVRPMAEGYLENLWTWRSSREKNIATGKRYPSVDQSSTGDLMVRGDH